MTIDPAHFRAIGAALVSEYSGGSMVTISSAQYDCIEAPIDAAAAAARFGFRRAYRTSVKISYTDISAATPTARTPAVLDGTTYRIADVDIDRVGGIVTLHLEDI